MTQIKAFAKEFHLKVEADPLLRRAERCSLPARPRISRRPLAWCWSRKTVDGVERRVREGGIHLPASLKGVVEAVLGLDNRPRRSPTFAFTSGALPPPAAIPAPGRHGVQVPRKRQRSRADHRIIELGGGYKQADLTAYFKTLGLPAPAINRGFGRWRQERSIKCQQRRRRGDAGH